MNLYLLSIIGQIQSGCVILSTMLFFAIIVFFVIMCASIDTGNNKLVSFAKPYTRILPILLFFTMLGAALIPSQNNLIKAHIMLEGKEIVTAETIKEITSNIDAKVDNVIQNFNKGQ